MTDILVTFEDGTTELRAANSPLRHRIPYYDDEELFRGRLPAWEQLAVHPRLLHRFTACGRSGARVFVWRIVGSDPMTGALLGEWQSAIAETAEEQIARLTRERDAAIKRAEAAEAKWTR